MLYEIQNDTDSLPRMSWWPLYSSSRFSWVSLRWVVEDTKDCGKIHTLIRTDAIRITFLIFRFFVSFFFTHSPIFWMHFAPFKQSKKCHLIYQSHQKIRFWPFFFLINLEWYETSATNWPQLLSDLVFFTQLDTEILHQHPFVFALSNATPFLGKKFFGMKNFRRQKWKNFCRITDYFLESQKKLLKQWVLGWADLVYLRGVPR